METYSSDPNFLNSKPTPFRIERTLKDINEIEWTIENLVGVLTPGQKKLEEVPKEDEWATAFFEEILTRQMPKVSMRGTWRYKDGLLSDLRIMPFAPENYKAPSNSHIEIRLTPLIAAVPDSRGLPGAQVTISVEVAFGAVHANREFRVNGHGDWQTVE